jgi:hypothetical protein
MAFKQQKPIQNVALCVVFIIVFYKYSIGPTQPETLLDRVFISTFDVDLLIAEKNILTEHGQIHIHLGNN